MGTMMEEQRYARYTIVDITISGKNVTTSLKPYLLDFTFNDKLSTEVDSINLTLDDRDELFCNEWMPMTGDRIEVTIRCFNWSEDDDEQWLNCGIFEIQTVEDSGPPNKVTIEAVSSLNSNIRREIRSRKWQSSTFRAICLEIARANGLQLRFIDAPLKDAKGNIIAEDGEDLEVAAIDQTEQTDLGFLSKLADDNGYLLKLDPETLTICSREYLETQDPIIAISKSEISNRKSGRQAFDLYKEAKASYFDPNKRKRINASTTAKKAKYVLKNNPELQAKWDKGKKGSKAKGKKNIPVTTVSYLDQANIYGGGKVLVIRQKFKDEKQALRVAEALLRRKNSGEWKISGDIKGNPFLMAGVVVQITEYGQFNGRYFIENTTHTVTKSGYRTSFIAHRVYGDIVYDNS